MTATGQDRSKLIKKGKLEVVPYPYIYIMVRNPGFWSRSRFWDWLTTGTYVLESLFGAVLNVALYFKVCDIGFHTVRNSKSYSEFEAVSYSKFLSRKDRGGRPGRPALAQRASESKPRSPVPLVPSPPRFGAGAAEPGLYSRRSPRRSSRSPPRDSIKKLTRILA